MMMSPYSSNHLYCVHVCLFSKVHIGSVVRVFEIHISHDKPSLK